MVKIIETSQDFFVISDTHFNHKNIIKYCNRPFTTVQDMNTVLLKLWNSIIKKDDIVFFLGDFALNIDQDSELKIYEKLNGNKIFIRGNHDKKSKIPFIKEDKIFIKYKKKYKFLLQHYYEKTWEGRDKNVKLIHGHTHNSQKKISEFNYSYNASIEVNDYCPIHIQEIIENLNSVI